MGRLLSHHLLPWHSFNKLSSGSFFVQLLSKSSPFLDFVASRFLSSHLNDWSSQKASPTSLPFKSKWIPPFFSLTLIWILPQIHISIVTYWALALPHSIYVLFFLPFLTVSSITTSWRQNCMCSACITSAGLIPGVNVRLNT